MLASASAAEGEGGDSSNSNHYHRHASLYESVSAEPLTFEPPMEPEPIDRARLLVEAESSSDDGDDDEDDHEWIEKDHQLFVIDGGDDFEDAMDNYEVAEDGYYDAEGGDYEMIEGGGEEEDDDNEGHGMDNSNQAISRSLRRRLDNPDVEDRYLAKKDSFRDDSIPIVSVIRWKKLSPSMIFFKFRFLSKSGGVDFACTDRCDSLFKFFPRRHQHHHYQQLLQPTTTYPMSFSLIPSWTKMAYFRFSWSRNTKLASNHLPTTLPRPSATRKNNARPFESTPTITATRHRGRSCAITTVVVAPPPSSPSRPDLPTDTATPITGNMLAPCASARAHGTVLRCRISSTTACAESGQGRDRTASTLATRTGRKNSRVHPTAVLTGGSACTPSAFEHLHLLLLSPPCSNTITSLRPSVN